jgi:hypothetical protein
MSEVFYLHAANGDARPALTLGQGLPKEVNGLPAFYFWRPAIRDGRYVHPVKGWELSVTPDRRRGWESTFRQMRAAGVEVPIIEDHREEARKSLGYVVDVRQNGDWYEELHQYLGDDARTVALRNRVSVGINPQFKDGTGRKWGDAIFHSAIVPGPVVPGQGDAVPVNASRGSMPDVFELAVSNRSPSMDLITKLRELFGAAELSEEELLAKVKALHDGAAAAKTAEEEMKLSRQAEQTELAELKTAKGAVETELADAKAKLATAETRIMELSRPAKQPDPEALDALAEADEAGLDSLVSTGRINPATRDKLAACLIKVDGKPNAFTLSRALSGTPVRLSRQIIEALKENTAVTPGEQTGVQTLSRETPGEQADQAQADAEYVKERAARVAPMSATV